MEEYKKEIAELLLKRYGLTIEDCFDDQDVETAFIQKETAEELVDYIAEKRDLDRIDTIYIPKK